MSDAAAAAAPAAAAPTTTATDAPAPASTEARESAAGGEQESADAAATAAAKRWKLKVDGEELDYDPSDEEVVKRDVQMGRAAQKRMAEAAKVRRTAEQLVARLRSDPIAVLTDPRLQIDPQLARAAAEKLISRQLEDELLSPEERATREKDAELERYRTKEKEAARKAEEQRYRELQQKAEQNYTTKFKEALTTAGVPQTAFTVRRMAQYQLYCNKHNIDVAPADLAAKVRQDYIDEQRALFGAADGDVLLQLVGDDTFGKMREADLKRHRPRNPDGTFTRGASPQNNSEPDKPAKREVMNRAELMRQANKAR